MPIVSGVEVANTTSGRGSSGPAMLAPAVNSAEGGQAPRVREVVRVRHVRAARGRCRRPVAHERRAAGARAVVARQLRGAAHDRDLVAARDEAPGQLERARGRGAAAGGEVLVEVEDPHGAPALARSRGRRPPRCRARAQLGVEVEEARFDRLPREALEHRGLRAPGAHGAQRLAVGDQPAHAGEVALDVGGTVMPKPSSTTTSLPGRSVASDGESDGRALVDLGGDRRPRELGAAASWASRRPRPRPGSAAPGRGRRGRESARGRRARRAGGRSISASKSADEKMPPSSSRASPGSRRAMTSSMSGDAAAARQAADVDEAQARVGRELGRSARRRRSATRRG